VRAVLSLPAAVLAMATLAACDPPAIISYPVQARGNHVDEAEIKELVPGTTTTKDVMSLLGSPTARATFDDNTWLYISERTKPVIAGTQAVEGQEVVSLKFDDSGVLRSVGRKTQADAMPVSVVSRTTPSPGDEASFLQQLLGNVGKFSGGVGGGGSSPGSGVNIGR